MLSVYKRPRILALDLLRGYFLFVVIIDHLNFFPSVFELVTGRGQLWASAAEGFFIISGLLVGYIYGPRMVKNACGAAKKLWQRALLLYVLTVLLTLLFVWWGNNSDIWHVKEGLWTQPPWGELLSKTLLLQYYYGWADFLPYYAVFMAWAPLALYACIKGKGWLVLAVSALCWLMRGDNFNMAWQLLFMGGMVTGWYLPKIEQAIKKWSPTTKQRARQSLYVTAIIVVIASALSEHVAEYMVHFYAGFAALPHIMQAAFLGLDNIREFMTPYIVKWTLEPGRLITAVLWFAALYVFVRQHETRVNQVSRGLFKTLGERSLVVYVTHALVVFELLLLVPSHIAFGGVASNSAVTAMIIALIYGIVVGWKKAARYAKAKKQAGLRRLRLINDEI